jgi:UDP-glucose 4-epimerase
MEGMQPMPLSPYAASKASAEAYCMMHHHLYGLKAVCLRYFNVYGPRQDPSSPYASVIPRFSSCFASGKAPTLFGDGEQTRDFVHVSDVVRANILAAEKDISGECINVASGKAITLNGLAAAFQAATGKRLEPEHAAARPGDIRHSSADIRKAKRLLGFTPSLGIEEGLKTLTGARG